MCDYTRRAWDLQHGRGKRQIVVESGLKMLADRVRGAPGQRVFILYGQIQKKQAESLKWQINNFAKKVDYNPLNEAAPG
jgi:hypothetical protein